MYPREDVHPFEHARFSSFIFASSAGSFNMRFTLMLAALAAPSALAFPWLRPEGLEALMSHPEAQKEIKRKLQEYEDVQAGKVAPRQLSTGLIPGLVTLLGGSLQAVYDNVIGLIPTNDAVNGLKKFPERTFIF
jgi:hypothetical protein